MYRGRVKARVLTINSGSSTIKYAVYEDETCVSSGAADVTAGGRQEAIASIARDRDLLEGVTAIGFRIVHGGRTHVAPEILTPALIDDLRSLATLAPDHIPDQVEALEAFERLLPKLPKVACFDTAFHRTISRVAQLYGLTRALADEGVVRYGFHGLSYSYIVDELRRLDELPERLIVAHLGNGASMCAIRNGESVDTSMGLTPTGGFLMSTRSGDLDPGIVLHLIRERKMSVDDVDQLVNKQGGLQGLSGISSDMRELVRASRTHPEATEAIAVFCYQIRRFLGAYIAVLGGLDMLVFTGGIGEHTPEVREGVCTDLEALGIALDPDANRAGESIISERGSRVLVRVMRTNEEVMIARYTAKIVEQAFSPAHFTS